MLPLPKNAGKEVQMSYGRPRARRDWREIAVRFIASGCSFRSYARNVGVCTETLRRWVNEVEEEKTEPEEKALTFVEVEIDPPLSTHPSLEGPALPMEIYIGHDGGVHLRMSGLPPASWLAELARRC